MKIELKLLILILLLPSFGLVLGDQPAQSADLVISTPGLQIDRGADGSLASTSSLASEQNVFVGSNKSNKYHYPDCQWAKKIHPENEIWFSSSEDARSHGYVPCKVCNPP